MAHEGQGNVPSTKVSAFTKIHGSVKQEFEIEALKNCHGIGCSGQLGDGTLTVSVEDGFIG